LQRSACFLKRTDIKPITCELDMYQCVTRVQYKKMVIKKRERNIKSLRKIKVNDRCSVTCRTNTTSYCTVKSLMFDGIWVVFQDYDIHAKIFLLYITL